MTERRILLVDGTNLVMRFAHAMAPTFVADPINAAAANDVQAVVSAALRAVLECARVARCEHAIVAVDGAHSWRKEVYPEYKAGRVVSTRSWSDRLGLECANRGIQFVGSNGYEADDVIATLARRANLNRRAVAVLSSDSDLLVLASDACDVYQFGRKEEPRYALRSPDWIRRKYELDAPSKLRDLKAIAGENGDNLPGLDGYGPVKARKLLQRWGSADNLLDSVALTEPQRVRLTLMLRLVTLSADAPIAPVNAAACRLPVVGQ